MARRTMVLPVCVLCMVYTPPTLRDRRRYLRFELLCERPVDKRAILRAIWDSVYALYGELGASESKLWLIEYHPSEDGTRGVGILRCAHDRVEEVRAALACIYAIDTASIGIRVIKTSGTIKGASK
ncbi:MAG TPA: ribonuclease P protein component 2 [Methanomicrobia archaeon]|nr:ribonuclease P protein component 2 [Methanomicrobia archaeon]